ncbi:MAG: hypothetical protein ACRD13_05840 [Terriglobales bacterium]
MRRLVAVALWIAVAMAATQIPAAAQSGPQSAQNQMATFQATAAAADAAMDEMAGNAALAQLDATEAQAAAASVPGNIQAQVAAAQAQMDAIEAQQNADAGSMAQPPFPSQSPFPGAPPSSGAPPSLRAGHGWIFAAVAAVGLVVVLALVAHSHAPVFVAPPRPAGL